MIELAFKKKLLGAAGEFTLEADLRIEQGEFVTLFGESGAGKTTLLRCLAGLAEPDAGSIRVNGATWFDSSSQIRLPVQSRRIGYMFQDYALFPNMSVRGNLEFALKRGADPKRVDALIEMMRLGELQHRRPATLSGGQQQRVALGRALAAEPTLLLLDEPFAALDHETRLRLQDEVLQLQRRFRLTTVSVSHDVSEVYRLAERVFIIEQGRITRGGKPADLFGAAQAGGKFSFAGEILAIEAADVVFVVTLLVGNQIVRVMATQDEVQHLKPGQRVTLMSKAFNPVLAAC
jgi:molybdate transport system ATP-binding protein